MAVYKANLFMTTSGISDQGEGEKRLGEIYVSIIIMIQQLVKRL